MNYLAGQSQDKKWHSVEVSETLLTVLEQTALCGATVTIKRQFPSARLYFQTYQPNSHIIDCPSCYQLHYKATSTN